MDNELHAIEASRSRGRFMVVFTPRTAEFRDISILLGSHAAECVVAIHAFAEALGKISAAPSLSISIFSKRMQDHCCLIKEPKLRRRGQRTAQGNHWDR